MRKTVITLYLALVASAALPAVSHAQAQEAQSSTTRMVRFAGVLTDASGGPLVGPQTVTFTVYDAADGGAALWTETLAVTADEHGRYATYLGSTVALPQHLFSTEQARWIGTSVDGRELARTALVAVPYALKAADADSLGGTPLSSFVLTSPDGRLQRADGATFDSPAVDGTGIPNQLAKWGTSTTLGASVMSESVTNRVGVGLPDPTGGGVVDSVFSIKNYDYNTGFAILNETQQRRLAINTLADGGWQLYDGGNNTWNAGLTQQAGNVGLGISPNSIVKLYVDTGNSYGIWSSTTATSGIGIVGIANAGTGAAGVYGASSEGFAGYFLGKVNVAGTLYKGGGAFKIDHPMDPTNKYLQHSFVESPDMMNVYNGNVALDANGEAWVTMPEWFEALNRDFRYQLTPLGAPGPNLYVAAKVSGNTFKIAGGVPGGEVSWQVTGIRQDAFANANRIVVEVDKPEDERGTFMHAEAFGQPAAASLLEKHMQQVGGKPATGPVKK